MKKNYILLIIMLVLLPTPVLASSSNNSIPIEVAIGVEAFVSIHMSLFVLWPLAQIFNKDGDVKKLFIKFFAIRAAILLFFDFFVTTSIFIIDFLAVFVGAFILMPISSRKKKNVYTQGVINMNNQNTNSGIIKNITIKCVKCGSVLNLTDKFCGKCGAAFDGNNVSVEASPNATIQVPSKVPVLPSSFDTMFNLSEDKMLEEFINRELTKAGVDKNSKLIPSDVLNKKKKLNIIFAILLFVFVSIIFFHFPIYTYIVGAVILFIFYKVTRKYDLIKYLKKELKSRPSEKVSNIVMNVKSTFVEDNSRNVFVISICVSVILPLIIFINPRILYEKVDNGYAVRFYTFGLTNFTTATIPETHKGEKVVSLRGNTFSNMPLLEEVTLPDSITEIRGQAFKNDRSLKKVNIPSKLEYLGGGAFYNCTSITSIEFPDTVTYIGGEAFYNATSLQSVKLSNNITEIRGSTFENCSSLTSITIPDSVTRIGGHAFYGNSSLSEVTFTENSQLNEIGSSAFRMCDNLYNIKIPSGVYVNERAFKESPTIVKEFGEVEYGSLVDTTAYAYDNFIFIHIGESDEINKYRTSAQLQDAYISLESVTLNVNYYEFTLKYVENNVEQVFTLTATEPYKVINDKVAVELASDYVFEYYSDKVSLNVYYN